MNIYLYNTLSRKKELFKPLKNKRANLYTCGPTVYDYDHLGHAWTYTMTDFLRRVLEYNNYKVKHAMNITDVGHLESDADTGEDKIEKSAREQKKSAWEIADYYTKIYLANRKKLNLLEPQIICKATDHIKEMISLIKILIKKGVAYQIDDGIYFDVAKFPKYGRLSGNILKKLKAGARIEINPQKRHPADFALWKFTPSGARRQMEWDSPWAPARPNNFGHSGGPPNSRGKTKGFPGWHIECSAMSMKYLGNAFKNSNFYGERSRTIDIHTGGEDNIFPHHESEIAQSEAATGKKFVNYWFHPRFLLVEGKKMSKSLKNFYTLADIEKRGFSSLDLRYLFLTAHYRSRLNFTWQGLKAAQAALNKLHNFLTAGKIDKAKTYNEAGLRLAVLQSEAKFHKSINNDLNIPQALSMIWKMTKDKNLAFSVKKELLLKFDKVLGLNLAKIKKLEIKIPAEIKRLVQLREKARQEKNWQKADKIRKEIEEKGYKIEDTERGQLLIPKNDYKI